MFRMWLESVTALALLTPQGSVDGRWCCISRGEDAGDEPGRADESCVDHDAIVPREGAFPGGAIAFSGRAADCRGIALAFGAVAIAFGALEDAGDGVKIEADGSSKATSTAYSTRCRVHVAKGTGFEEGATAPIASAIAPIALAQRDRPSSARPHTAGWRTCAGWVHCSSMCERNSRRFT